MRDWWKLCGVVSLLAAAAYGQSHREMFSDVPAEFRRDHLNYSKQPVYFECLTNGLAIHPAEVTLRMQEVLHPGFKLKRVLDDLEKNASKKFLVVVQRPAAGLALRAVNQLLVNRAIEVGVELVDASTPWAEAVKQPSFVLSPLGRASGKHRSVFVCRTGRVAFLDKDRICTDLKQFVDRFRPLARLEDVKEVERQLKRRDFGDENYSGVVDDLLSGRTAIHPRPNWQGETGEQLTAEGSRFRQSLATLDKAKRSILFVVREDGLAPYQQAREVAEKAGFEWSARYLDHDEPITFSIQDQPSGGGGGPPAWW